ncbi:MAG: hypothetical protein AAGF12_30430 [Myxococcota bacterium]
MFAKHWIVISFLLVLTSTGASAQGRNSSDCEEPYLQLAFRGAFEAQAQREIARQLQASVAAEGFRLCTGADASGSPVATIRLAQDPEEPTLVSIFIEDQVTEKRVSRDLDLREFPDDSRPLALAVATDELLRASWMELALADPADTEEVTTSGPREVQAVVRRAIQRAAEPNTTVGLQFGFQSYTEGEVHFGGDLYFTRWLLPAFGFELSFGLRRGLATESRDGSVVATVVGGAGELLVRPLRLDPISLAVGAGVRMLSVTFQGRPNPGARGVDEAGLGFVGFLRTFFALAAGPIELRLGGGLGVPFRSVRAFDDGERVSAVGGLEVLAHFSFGVRLGG